MRIIYKIILLAVVAIACSLTVSGEQSVSTERRTPVQLTTNRQLFIDDALIEAESNITRLMHQPVKMPAPVLVGDQPWENWTIDLFGIPSILYDKERKLYRMWYTAYHVPTDNYYICYATSKDGLHWTKPILGLYAYKGSKANNIVNPGRGWWPNSTVIFDKHETNPERRYKMLSWDFAPSPGPKSQPDVYSRPSGDALYKEGRPLGISVAFSPDGIHWHLYRGNPVLRNTGDTNMALGWDEHYKKYIGYFRPSYAAAGGIRVIGFSTSDDFVHWTPPEIILRPDSLDPTGDEFYCMPVTKYQGKYIGFLWVYHNSPNPAQVKALNVGILRGTQQALETQLTYSEDGKHFIRVGDRQPFLPVGPPEDWDQGMTTVSDLMVHGNEIWLYYGGWGTRHSALGQHLGEIVNGHRIMGAIGLAKLRLDGFVSLHAGDTEGTVLTRPILLKDQSHLRINADASKGILAAEILGQNYEPLPGFALKDSVVMRENSTSKPMAWRARRDLSSLHGQVIRIRFYLRNADLYSMQLN